MKLATVRTDGKEMAAVVSGERVTLIETINKLEQKNWSTNLFDLLQKDQLTDMIDWYTKQGEQKIRQFPSILKEEVEFGPLYRHAGKIWGVGMNYMEKAIELSGRPPEEEPVIFMKPNSSVIGSEDSIILPLQSSEVTAEAELAIIIGKTCKNIGEEEAPSVVAGFTTSLDMTAKDIHARNPRFMQRSKSFDTFFSFGPYLITTDEYRDVRNIAVETVLNGDVCHRNIVANMMYQPWFIVSFFSQIMTLNPGDVIMTGTPGSVVIRNGDVAECRIAGFQSLRNPVLGVQIYS